MPLIKGKSKKAFGENVSTEMKSGKPQKQSLAIAYSIKNRNKKKMADGGMAQDPDAKEDQKLGSDVEELVEDHFKDNKDAEEEEGDKLALGGAVEMPNYSKRPYDRNPGTPAPKPDNRRLDPKDYMSSEWAGGPDPVRKPDNKRLPMDEYMSNEHMSTPLSDGGIVDADTVSPEEMEMVRTYRAKKLAFGGMAENTNEPSMPKAKKDNMRPSMDEYMSTDSMAPRLAKGGMVNTSLQQSSTHDNLDRPDSTMLESEEDGSSVADRIMKKKSKKMADGGMVDLNHNSMEHHNHYDGRNVEILKENYDDDMKDLRQPEDSNEHRDDLEDADSHDMVSSIRKKMKYKREI